MSDGLVRPVRAGAVKTAPQTHEVVASEAERAALAAAFGLSEILDLRGVFDLVHEQGGVIAAALHMTASVMQTCVVSLEPFAARLDEHAALRFIPAAKRSEAEAAELDPESLEGPDEIPFAGDMIDLGAALAEQLALSLDPYPRKPDAVLPADFLAQPASPFEVLNKTKRIL